MCANTGGPCKTINRPLAQAHVGLGVTDKEFDIVAGHLGTTLKEFKVPQKEYNELMVKSRRSSGLCRRSPNKKVN
jgi:hemoglobin